MTKKRFLFLFSFIFAIFSLFGFKSQDSINTMALEKADKTTTFIHCAGRTSSLLLSQEGVVYGWGLWGEANDVTLSKKLKTPTDIGNNIELDADDYFINIFSGEQRCFILTDNGRVFGMGSGSNKQLGYSDYFFKPNPVELTDLFSLTTGEKITFIGCGDDFNIALTNKHRVISFGKNEDGQLGITSDEKDALTYDITSKFILQDGDYIENVKCGASHSLALSHNGYVYVWGSNKFGQLGIKDEIVIETPTRLESIVESVVEIEVGRYTSYVLTNQALLYGFGSDSYGQLATHSSIVTSNKKETPYLMNGGFSLEGDEYIKSINSGYYYLIVKTNLGNYYAVGQNSTGQLGNGSTLTTSIPQKIELQSVLTANDEITSISCGLDHVIATTAYGHILAWGSNLQGQLSEDYNGPQSNYTVIDITYNFPPIIIISTNASSVEYKTYVLNVEAFYLDNQSIEETFYAVSSSIMPPKENWVQFTNSIVVSEGEGTVYVHIRVDSAKGSYYYTSKPYFLDHVSPTIRVYDKNNQEINQKYYNSTIFASAMDNNSSVEIVYSHNGKQYTTTNNTISFTEDGTYKVYAVDAAKNSSATIEFTIDTILPTITKIDNNLINGTSFSTRDKEITIYGSEALICYQLGYKGVKADSYTALNDNESSFKVKLKKGVNTLTIIDLAGNESLTYEIIYSPRFFQDTQLLLIVFGSLAAIFVVIIIIAYTIRNKRKLAK